MPDYLGCCLELTGSRFSQYAGWNFNSMCKFGDVHLGADENGIHILSSGDRDDTERIRSFFVLFISDWGIENQKRIRSIYIGYETDGRLMLTVKDDDDNEREYLLSPIHLDNQQHSAKLLGDRNGKGRYWMMRIDNLDGSDFSIRSNLKI
jgi:hypothetical protein